MAVESSDEANATPTKEARDVPPTDGGPAAARPVWRRPWPRWLRNVRRGVAAALVIFLVLTLWSIGTALLRPGTDSVQARLAEWGRDHGMSTIVTWAENQQYQHNQPKVGGSLSAADRAQLHAGAPPTSGTDLPTAIPPIVSPVLPGEGAWRVLAQTGSQPVVMRALLRPDRAHTSYLAYVAWIDTSRVRFVLHPGSVEPGLGGLRQPDTIPARQRSGLMATFNGGFRLKDALMGPYGGYYADGHRVGRLVNGMAAEIFRSDGSMTVGMWGRDGSLSDHAITAVRQNLRLLVDNGQVQADAKDGSGQTWGYTIKNAYYVWRSGVGVTSTGDIVYAMGPTLSVQTLAQILRRAGAVRAMELDINPDWVSFMSYTAGGNPATPAPTKLMNFSRPADRYYKPSSRDFVAVYAR